MANLTANKFAKYKEGLMNIPFKDASATARYRGAAVAVVQFGDSGDVGYLDDTFDGTACVKFVGVNRLNVTSDANTSCERAIMHEGAFEFTRATTSNRWVGRPVWFSDDQTVKLTPTGRYPVWAGYVIKDVDSTTVLVEITAATQNNRHWQTIPLKLAAADITTASATPQATMSAVGPAFIRNLAYNIPIGMSATGAKAKVRIKLRKRDASASSIILSSSFLETSAAATGTLAVNSAVDHDDKLILETYCSAATPMAKGRIQMFLNVMPLT